jgi:hypothetical protein
LVFCCRSFQPFMMGCAKVQSPLSGGGAACFG